MKFVKSVVTGLMLLVVMLLAVIVIKTILFSPQQSQGLPTFTERSPDIDEQNALLNFSKALSFPTISTEDGKRNDAAFEALHRYIKQTYPSVFSKLQYIQIGEYGMLFKWEGRDASLKPALYMAHQDVVPIAPGTEGSWQHPPFNGDIAGGYVWGRGAIDNKASLVALLEATSKLLEDGYTPRRTTYFYFGDDEEIGGKTAIKASQYFASQGVRFEYVLDEGGVIADKMVPGITVPLALISVAEKGMLNLKLTAKTEGGHSSLPTSQLAIGEISQAIVNILQHPPSSDITGPTRTFLEVIAPYQSLMNRAVIANLWLFKPLIIKSMDGNPLMAALMHTTQAPTIFNAGTKSNVLPYFATAIVNFRLAPFDSVAGVRQHVSTAIENPDIQVEETMSWEPSPVSSTTGVGFELLTSALKATYNNQVVISPFIVTGATDSRHFVSVADNVYRFLPMTLTKEDMTRFHGTNERYGTDNFIQMIKFYYSILSN